MCRAMWRSFGGAVLSVSRISSIAPRISPGLGLRRRSTVAGTLGVGQDPLQRPPLQTEVPADLAFQDAVHQHLTARLRLLVHVGVYPPPRSGCLAGFLSGSLQTGQDRARDGRAPPFSTGGVQAVGATVLDGPLQHRLTDRSCGNGVYRDALSTGPEPQLSVLVGATQGVG